jgi:hypothetical protein
VLGLEQEHLAPSRRAEERCAASPARTTKPTRGADRASSGAPRGP